jgi:t-SNARE complex subunit (syntaxin)
MAETYEETSESEVNLIFAAERKIALSEIEKDVNDVNEIFKELAFQTNQQSIPLDNITDSIEKSVIANTESTDNLKQVERSTISRRIWKGLAVIGVLVVGSVATLAIVKTAKQN